ncbi:MAG: sugar phosphate isomerase/epimerase [Planctomycetales bacterium]|nr:sugar phosphate isomerase/epimerase [Planctomycetales bacterium]
MKQVVGLLLLRVLFAGCASSFLNPLAVSIDPATANDAAALSEFHSAGITLVELSGVHGILHDDGKFADMKRTLDTCGFSVNSIHYPYGPDFDISNLVPETRTGAIQEIEFYLGRLGALGGRCLVVHPSFEPVGDDERQARLKVCRNSILELDGLMKKYPGMMIALEDLPRTCLGNTSAELNALIKGTSPDRIGICLDTNHMLQEDLITFTKNTVSRIMTVHIADYDGEDERHWFPGQGINDWHTWAQLMRGSGYEGPMLYEVTWPIARGNTLTPRQIAALVKLNYEDYFAK